MLPVGAAYDIESFRLVGEALLNKEDVYTSAAVGRHPYLPLQMYIVGLATFLTRVTPLPFIIWIKLPAVFADTLIVIFIFRAVQQATRNQVTSLSYALLFALNPISILVTSYHGQFDPIPVLLLLLAWYSWHFGHHIIRSATLLGFAILNKTWPIVFLPVAFIRLPRVRQRFTYTGLAVGIPIFFTAFYVIFLASNPLPMLQRAVTHAGVPGYWGLSSFIFFPGVFLFDPDQVLQLILPWQRFLMLAVGLAVLWWTRRQDALNALLTIILTVFAIMLGMGIQWLLWPVAFAILAREESWLKWYSILGAMMMVVHLYGIHLYPTFNQLFDPGTATLILRLSSLPVWLIVVFWSASRLRRALRPPVDAVESMQSNGN
jgi:hypothetical protein